MHDIRSNHVWKENISFFFFFLTNKADKLIHAWQQYFGTKKKLYFNLQNDIVASREEFCLLKLLLLLLLEFMLNTNFRINLKIILQYKFFLIKYQKISKLFIYSLATAYRTTCVCMHFLFLLFNNTHKNLKRKTRCTATVVDISCISSVKLKIESGLLSDESICT